MNQPLLSPLAAGYLDELGRLLHGIDPVERVEVLDGVREHLAASLEGTAGTDEDVRAALAELGSPQSVADEAYADRPRQGGSFQAYHLPGPQPTYRPIPSSSRTWYPIVVLALEVLTLLLVLAMAGTAGGVTEYSVSQSGAAGQPDVVTVTETTFQGSIGAGIAALFVSVPFVLVLIVMVGVSALWTRREKVALVALAPAVAVAFGALPEIGYALVGVNGVYAGAWTALGLTLLGGGIILTRLISRASHRAQTLRSA